MLGHLTVPSAVGGALGAIGDAVIAIGAELCSVRTIRTTPFAGGGIMMMKIRIPLLRKEYRYA